MKGLPKKIALTPLGGIGETIGETRRARCGLDATRAEQKPRPGWLTTQASLCDLMSAVGYGQNSSLTS